MQTADREIVTQILAGDRERFHELVRRHATPLWATVRSSLRDLDDAREVFQETWLRAFERLDTLRDPSRLRSWLLSIALNQVRQRLRRAQASDEPLSAAGQVAAAGAGVSGALEHDEEVVLLRERIAGLPPRQREVMDLRLNHGQSHAQIGELLSISEESSRANYYQALRRLRAAFDGDAVR